MVTDLLYRLRALLRRRAVERELEEELRFHLEQEIDKRLVAGLRRDEATRMARIAFGGVERIKEECRDQRGVRLLETIVQDLRYGLRTVRRAPVFSAAAIATIALSTASLATVFTLGHTLFFRPLPVDRPDGLVVVSATRGRPNAEGSVSYPDYVGFRDRTKALSGLAAHYSTAPLFVSANGQAQEVNGAVVTANFFPLLRVRPALGRFFDENEDRVPDRDRVAVLGHDFWRRWFASSSEALGATLRVNGVDFTVIGVAPAAFAGVTPYPAEIFIPTMMLGVGYRWCDNSLASDCTVLEMIGRLAPGRIVADAAAELPTLMPASWEHAPIGENSGVRVSQPRGTTSDPSQVKLVRILIGVAVALLLVCCANLAGLLGAQSAARASEFGIRMSLGAPSSRVIRQLMTESLMLAVAGGVAGVLLSRGFIAALQAMFYVMDDEGHPMRYDFSLTAGVVLTGIAASVIAGCLFSVVPAVNAVRRDVADLKTRRATVRWSAGSWLLGVQAAVAVALVAVTGLLTFSARTVMAGTQFETSHVALMRLRPRLMKYPPDRAQRFQRQVVSRLAAVPGVESVSMVGIGVVLDGGRASVALPGWTSNQQMPAGYNEIGPRYFDTLRTPLLSGREFDDHDVLTSPRVAIVNETLARRLWPAGSPIGATILIRSRRHQVVGVVSDVPLNRRTEGAQPFVYASFWQNPQQIDSRLCIRVAGDPAAMLPALAREVNGVDPEVPIAETITLPIQMAGWIRPLRLTATFIGYAAALAMLLTAIGLYGTLSFSVSRRTKEIGIRMALGAARSRVLGFIVREGMKVVVAGVVAGVGLAAAGSRLVTHLLYGSAATDWLYYVGGAALVLLVGLFASLLPARRAAALEPLVALRQE
jgi:putative ABC transport system permease protein